MALRFRLSTGWVALALLGPLSSCNNWVEVDPLDYGCQELWVREGGSCIDAEAFQEAIRDRMWTPGNEVMGFAFAAGDRDGLAVKGACGLARTDKDGGVRPFEADMRIESGSTSKMLTTVAALRVLELSAGDASLETVMNNFLPREWELHEELREARVQLGELLTHRSGIVNANGIGLKPILRDEEWFRADWMGSYHYANHNMDAAGFMSAYLYDYLALRAIEDQAYSAGDYDSVVNLAVRDTHYELLKTQTIEPLAIDADCIRFAASSQKVWLYADGASQDGYKLPSRTNCMTSGWLMSAPQWVQWVHGVQAGELLSPESLDLLNRWDAPWEALGWSSSSSLWRDHNGGYSPAGVGVRTMVGYRSDGFAVSLVANSKNASGLTGIAESALTLAAAGCE